MYVLASIFRDFHDYFMDLGSFWWMAWNAILAFVPVVLALIFFKREDQPRTGIRNVTFGLELVLVLLFLPNAPYVATDLVHFLETVRKNDASLWKLLGTEFPLYAMLMAFGLACYSFTVDRVLYAVRMRIGRAWAWFALFVIPLLSAVGVYLGRVARYNSWNILSDPRGILDSSSAILEEIRVAKVIVSIWLCLIVVHQIYRVFHDGIRYRLERRQAKISLRSSELGSPGIHPN